jgi:peroxiredoxin
LTSLQPGELASHFTLLGLDGREYSIPGDTAGQPLLLAFFRAGCPTCDVAFPYINRLRNAYPDGWRLWAVSQDDPARAARYASEHELDYPVLIDAPALDASILYDPPSTPTLYLIDFSGHVQYVSEGFAKTDMNELSALIASTLGAAPVEIAADGDGKPAMKPGCMARQRMPRRR